MTTTRDIVTRIARRIGVTPGDQVPTSRDAQAILDCLNGVIETLPLLRDGPWRDVILASSAPYSAKDGDRISPQGFDPIISMPTTFTDERGVERLQRDLSRVHVIGDGLYVWSVSRGAWGKADGLGLGDESPFGTEDEAGLVALAALAAADDYGAPVSATTAAQAAEALSSFEARFHREVPARVDDAFLRLSEMGQCGENL
jgi:hypothetical protein